MALWRGSSMNASEYKKYHESYMMDNQGSTAIHTFGCILFVVKCTLYNAILTRDRLSNSVSEYITIVLPLILSHTVCTDYLLMLTVVISGLIIWKCYSHFRNINIPQILLQLNTIHTQHIQSISCLRGLTYLITVFAILAVDFRVFPRSFAKTETHGYSLMDTGVGLFTFMSGLVHKDLHKYSLKAIIRSNFKFISVLVALGVARYWSVKALDYHEHVTEYGVHWNFFFTVAVCKLLSTLILYVSNQPFLLSILTLMLHEYLLYQGLQAWVFSDTPRTDLLSANREGICSSLGYTAIYLFAVHVKQVVTDRTVERYKVLVKLGLEGANCWLLLIILNKSRPISRVLANSAYCIYISAIILTLLCGLYFFECLCQDNDKVYFSTPMTLSAVNQNGLIYFLVGNLLTGAVNLTIQTLFVSSFAAVVLLNCYMTLNLGLMVYLKRAGLKM